MKKDKKYTDMEVAFLNALSSKECNGNIRMAMRTAGYSDTTTVGVIMGQLKEEIIEVAQNLLASYSIKAVLALEDTLDNSAQLGAANKIKAAKELLDRAGLVKPETDINLKIPETGIIILPAKAKRPEVATEEELEDGENG